MSGSVEQDAGRFAATPQSWTAPAASLTGADATAYGRSLLESAGVDLDALARRVGRPHLGAPGSPGIRSPRVNVALTPDVAKQLDLLATDGRTRSDIVREALADYLAAHSGGATA